MTILGRIRSWFWFYPDFILKTFLRFGKIRVISAFVFSFIFVFIGINFLTSKLIQIRGNTLTIGIVVANDTYSPFIQNSLSFLINSLQYNTLFDVSTNQNSLTVIPEVASNSINLNAQSTQYIIYLKRGISFSDGEQFNADSFLNEAKLFSSSFPNSEFSTYTFSKINEYEIEVDLPHKEPDFIDNINIPLINVNDYSGTGMYIPKSADNGIYRFSANQKYFAGKIGIQNLNVIVYNSTRSMIDAYNSGIINTYIIPNSNHFNNSVIYSNINNNIYQLYNSFKGVFINSKLQQDERAYLFNCINQNSVLESLPIGTIPLTQYGGINYMNKQKTDVKNMSSVTIGYDSINSIVLINISNQLKSCGVSSVKTVQSQSIQNYDIYITNVIDNSSDNFQNLWLADGSENFSGINDSILNKYIDLESTVYTGSLDSSAKNLIYQRIYDLAIFKPLYVEFFTINSKSYVKMDYDSNVFLNIGNSLTNLYKWSIM